MSKWGSKLNSTDCGKEWAIILAGGDGTRLKSLTRKIAGDGRPKQFCSVLGKLTLLEETCARAALEFAPQRTLYVVNRIHEPYYGPILGDAPASNLIAQPSNRGTAPAILYSLLRIAVVNPNAVVGFLPSDHYVSDNERFMLHVRAELETARRRRDLIVLLGLEPESPEVEYGWIEPTAPICGHSRVSGVRRFWEKPNQPFAQVLQLRGCLWNSFVMVASVQALLGIIESAIPQLYSSFIQLSPFLGTTEEANLIDKLYARMEEVNFSHRVLAHRPERLAVLKVSGVRWNDLGEPRRVLASLTTAGVHPHWLKASLPQFA
jgi:mannose-1-phosphate guanylyltransferase